jgi:hypothetical protein
LQRHAAAGACGLGALLRSNRPVLAPKVRGLGEQVFIERASIVFKACQVFIALKSRRRQDIKKTRCDFWHSVVDKYRAGLPRGAPRAIPRAGARGSQPSPRAMADAWPRVSSNRGRPRAIPGTEGKVHRVDPDFGSTLTVSNRDSL